MMNPSVIRFFLALSVLVASGLMSTSCKKGGGSGGAPWESRVGPTLDLIPSPTALGTVVVSGRTLRNQSRIRVEGGLTPTEGRPAIDGRSFALEVTLRPNRANQLIVTEIFSDGTKSPPTPIKVIQDSEPPRLWIDFPSDGSELCGEEFTLVGRFLDRLSGFLEVKVEVNDFEATTESGSGSNGSFVRSKIPLDRGQDNVVSVKAIDAVGNEIEETITVRAAPTDVPHLVILEGNDQTSTIRSELEEPLRLRILRGDGTAFVGKVVDFLIETSDGSLSLDKSDPWKNRLSLETNALGEATVFWRLGNDAGVGNNRVRVVSEDIEGDCLFIASASRLEPTQINVSSGATQTAPTGGVALEPLVVWVSDGCNGASDITVTFEVVGGGGQVRGKEGFPAESLKVKTDRTGRAEVTFFTDTSEGPNLVQARFEGQEGVPVEFFIYGSPKDSATTQLTGIVTDNASLPIGQAVCELVFESSLRFETTTDPQGRFTFPVLPDGGKADLRVDGSRATLLNGQPIDPSQLRFPELHYEPTILGNVVNRLPRPISLPRLDPLNDVAYDGSKDIVLGLPSIEGLKMTVKAGSMTLPDGRRPTPEAPLEEAIFLSLNPVHHDDIPMSMPDGASPPFAWTFQPAGAHFDPPVEVAYPNMTGAQPGALAFFLSFDHDTGEFEVVSTAHVTPDGSLLRSDPGSGLTMSGWGCNCPPYSVAGDCEMCPDGKTSENEDCDPCEEMVDRLREDYESSIGMPSAGLKHQLLCLADKACGPNKVECPGVPNWSEGFVQSVINEYSSNIGGNVFNDLYDGLPQWAIDGLDALPFFDATDFAAIDAGLLYHFPLELLPAFYKNCDELSRPDADDRHDCLFDQVIRPCFDEVGEFSPALRTLAKALVPIFAAGLREGVQLDCAVLGYITELLSGQSVDYPTIGENHREQDYFIQEFEDASSLTITSNASFFLRPGDFVQLKVERNGQDITNSSRYHIPIADDAVTITRTGLLDVRRSPLAVRLLPSLFQVIVENNGQIGIAQFGILDDDSDGDLLVDSYEIRIGRDPNQADANESDLDGDGVTDLHEGLLGTDPTSQDTDQDGLSDGLEIAQRSDPNDPNSFEGRLDSRAIVTVNGQSVRSDVYGRFRVGNVSAADEFGAGGPGTSPDFLSDEAFRAIGSFPSGNRTFYAFSNPFRIAQGETAVITELKFTETPPPIPASLDLRINANSIVEGEETACTVIATLGDGSTQDVTLGTSWTTYRTSNSEIATIDENGIVRGNSSGFAFLTATNGGATSTARIFVISASDPLTTIIGFVQFEDGTPARNAEISIVGLPVEGISGQDGRYRIEGVPTVGVPEYVLRAFTRRRGENYLGSKAGIIPNPGNLTDAGLIRLGETGGFGPVILSGMDPEDHGSSPGGAGWEMIRDIASFVVGESVIRPNPENVVQLGGSAANAAIARSAVEPLGYFLTHVTGSAIDSVNFFDFDTIYMPTSISDVSGGISQSDLDRVNLRGPDIIEFVNAGGGLACFSQHGMVGAYNWFPLNGLEDDRPSGGGTNVVVTPVGAFILSESAVNVVPFHTAFVGPQGFFGLDILAHEGDGEQLPLIIGGLVIIQP